MSEFVSWIADEKILKNLDNVTLNKEVDLFIEREKLLHEEI